MKKILVCRYSEDSLDLVVLKPGDPRVLYFNGTDFEMTDQKNITGFDNFSEIEYSLNKKDIQIQDIRKDRLGNVYAKLNDKEILVLHLMYRGYTKPYRGIYIIDEKDSFAERYLNAVKVDILPSGW